MRFISASVALQFLGLAVACPLHGLNDDVVPVINKRSSSPGQSGRVAIEDVRVFTGSSFSEAKTICLDLGYIVGVDGRCDGATTTVNGTGKYLIPGLIDSHVHLSDVQSLEDFTSYGCTTAMHMNCENYTQCNIMANQRGLASFVYATLSAVGNDSLHEEQNPTRPKSTLIYRDTNVTEWIESQFSSDGSSNFLKITAEVNGPSLDQQIQMVQFTHSKYGKQTMTHAAAIMAYEHAVESATDGIQHVPDDGILDSATIQKIKARDQFVTPTLNIFKYAFQKEPVLKDFFAIESGDNQTLIHAETNAKRLYEACVPLIVGTDSVGSFTLNGSAVTVPFGLTVHDELENFVRIVGMSPAEAINAATSEAAKWHRVTDRGVIEVGRRADLVMLNSNPLDNITNTRDIERVWVTGIEVDHVTKLQ